MRAMHVIRRLLLGIAVAIAAATVAGYGTANAQVRVEDQTRNAVTAIDILLEPDAVMLKRAEADNARLLKAFPQGFALDAAHLVGVAAGQVDVQALVARRQLGELLVGEVRCRAHQQLLGNRLTRLAPGPFDIDVVLHWHEGRLSGVAAWSVAASSCRTAPGAQRPWGSSVNSWTVTSPRMPSSSSMKSPTSAPSPPASPAAVRPHAARGE